MTNALLQIKIKQRLNKLASMDYDNIECWMVQEAFNKAQLEWTRRQIYGLNTRREGTEQSTGLTDDLRVLMTTAEKMTVRNKDLYVESDLPDNYLYYVRVDAMAKNDCCPARRMTVYEAEEANIGILLTTETKAPSFDWAETLSTLVGNTVRVYTNGKFSVTQVDLVYYRKPRVVQFRNCVDPATGNVSQTDVTCEFKDDVTEILIDEAAAILAGDIESMNQYQRETQNGQRNS